MRDLQSIRRLLFVALAAVVALIVFTAAADVAQAHGGFQRFDGGRDVDTFTVRDGNRLFRITQVNGHTVRSEFIGYSQQNFQRQNFGRRQFFGNRRFSGFGGGGQQNNALLNINIGGRR